MEKNMLLEAIENSDIDPTVKDEIIKAVSTEKIQEYSNGLDRLKEELEIQIAREGDWRKKASLIAKKISLEL